MVEFRESRSGLLTTVLNVVQLRVKAPESRTKNSDSWGYPEIQGFSAVFSAHINKRAKINAMIM